MHKVQIWHIPTFFKGSLLGSEFIFLFQPIQVPYILFPYMDMVGGELTKQKQKSKHEEIANNPSKYKGHYLDKYPSVLGAYFISLNIPF